MESLMIEYSTHGRLTIYKASLSSLLFRMRLCVDSKLPYQHSINLGVSFISIQPIMQTYMQTYMQECG